MQFSNDETYRTMDWWLIHFNYFASPVQLSRWPFINYLHESFRIIQRLFAIFLHHNIVTCEMSCEKNFNSTRFHWVYRKCGRGLGPSWRHCDVTVSRSQPFSSSSSSSSSSWSWNINFEKKKKTQIQVLSVWSTWIDHAESTNWLWQILRRKSRREKWNFSNRKIGTAMAAKVVSLLTDADFICFHIDSVIFLRDSLPDWDRFNSWRKHRWFHARICDFFFLSIFLSFHCLFRDSLQDGNENFHVLPPGVHRTIGGNMRAGGWGLPPMWNFC